MLVAVAALAAACGTADGRISSATATSSSTATTRGDGAGPNSAGAEDRVETAARSATSSTDTTAPPSTTVPSSPTTPATTEPQPLDLYAETGAGKLAPAVEGVPTRVYVPNSEADTVTVIDPDTYEVIDEFPVDALPHHVTPSWDLRTLYVLNTAGNTLTPIDPMSGKPGDTIPVEDPYNLYFTPEGSMAIVVAERFKRLDLRDPTTWELIDSIPIPYSGPDHADFSPDGRYMYVSCEFSGYLVKVDLVERRIVAERQIGVAPIDVKLSPDASKLFVADQGVGGVFVIDPGDLAEERFVPTGMGAHGLYPSRDATQLYVSNRLDGSVSVLDFDTGDPLTTWEIPGGGSPDMGGVSADGSRLWLSGRFHGEVYVFDTATGDVLARIPTGPGAHGLALFPQPGRYSLGHTGNYR